MRLALLCFFTTVLCTCVRAQNYEEFVPFRPGIIYNYANPFLGEGETAEAVSPVLGMHWPSYFEEFAQLYVTVPSPVANTVKVIPHFVGTELTSANDGVWSPDFFDRTEPPFYFRLEYDAAVGQEWMVNGTVVGRVDSIKEAAFFGLVDDVKYISLRDTVSGLVHPGLQLSRNYGMLSGPYFSDIQSTSVPLELVSLNAATDWGAFDEETVGEPFLSPLQLASSGGNYYQEEITSENFNGIAGQRIIHRHWRSGSPGCDPVLDASFTPHRVREVRYFQPDDGSEPLDSIVVPTYQKWLNINFIPFIGTEEQDWRALPYGSVYLDGWDSPRVVLPTRDDCLGAGMELSRELEIESSFEEVAISTGLPGPRYFRYSMLAAFEPETSDHGERHLVGVQSGTVNCGVVFNFEPLYTSTTDFPDDPLITLAPNPATDRVMITVPFEHGSVRLAVYDAAGRLLRNTSATGGDRWLNVTDLAAGVYTIVVNGAEGPLARRRVVVR